MGRNAKYIATEPGDIERIEQLVCEMPNLARVRITQKNGDTVDGTVVDRPTTQVFENDACDQGVNAIVRLEDDSSPPQTLYLWLSDIEKVEHLDSNRSSAAS
jgi:Protein of unknown function (DUF3247)